MGGWQAISVNNPESFSLGPRISMYLGLFILLDSLPRKCRCSSMSEMNANEKGAGLRTYHLCAKGRRLYYEYGPQF
jgi:hypothetical protein